MSKLIAILWLLCNGCKTLQPLSPATEMQIYDYSLRIRFVDGLASYDEVMRVLCEVPGHLSVETDYDTFHKDQHDITVDYMTMDRERMQGLKTRLAGLGVLHITEQRN